MTFEFIQHRLEPLCRQYQLNYEELVQQQLQLCLSTLKLCKGRILSSHFLSIEQIAHETPQWPYAIFLMALLSKAKQFYAVIPDIKIKHWDEMVPSDIKAWLSTNSLITSHLNLCEKNSYNPLLKLINKAQTLTIQHMNIRDDSTDQEEVSSDSKTKQQKLFNTLLLWVQSNGAIIRRLYGGYFVKDHG